MRGNPRRPSEERDRAIVPVDPTAQPTGVLGERLAGEFLRRRGYRVVDRNLATRFGEIDLLARRGREWVAVEVKTRRGRAAPEQGVHDRQLGRIARALEAIAPGLRPRPTALRIDVVAVRLDGEIAEVTWFRDVTL